MSKAAQNVIPAGEQLPVEQMAGQQRQEITPLQMFAAAMEKGIDIEKIREMRAFVEWHEGREAKKAFDRAMTAFRQESIPIIKNKHVKFKNKNGSFTEYDQATLDHVVETAAPFLGKHGFNYFWNRIPNETPQKIEVECVITHEAGHSIRTSLDGYPDESGGKNAIQAVISTVSYIERVTFLMLTGLAAKGHDTDGRPPAADGNDPQAPITTAQVTLIQKLIKETNTAQKAFLDWICAETLESIPAKDFNRAMAELNRKKRAQQANKEATK